MFNNPSAWAIYCKKIINPAKKSGCGWASVKYKGRKMDYYKNAWMKKKAQREAENAKNEAAQALTALSAGLTGLDSARGPELDPPSNQPGLLKATSLSTLFSNSKEHFVELESFTAEGKIQPFTVSVSTSAMLVLDLHSHLGAGEVCGYLAGHWDPNSHNLAITNTFPCLVPPDQADSQVGHVIPRSMYQSQLFQTAAQLVHNFQIFIDVAGRSGKDRVRHL